MRRLEESGLVDGPTAELLITAPADSSDEQLAEWLTEQGVLTGFQAQTILNDDKLPLVIGEYDVIDQIGRGGMGYVLKARHRTMKRYVAIKFLLPLYTVSGDLKQRFAREVEAAAKLEHPNIVPAYDAGSREDGSLYLVMKYIPGKNLRVKVKKEGPLSLAAAVDAICQVAAGLAFAHEQGVVHRDVKPSNLLIDLAGVVRVLDLGLARMKPTPGEAETDDLTGSGSIMGTVDYMAPEQAMDARSADHRSDIYSLGCTLYFLLIGKAPFAAESMMSRLLAHREGPIPKLTELRDVPEELEGIYQRMMAKRPDDRPQSMQELIDSLECIELEDEPDTANVATLDMDEDGTGSFIQLPEDDTIRTHPVPTQVDVQPEQFANNEEPTLAESSATQVVDDDFNSETLPPANVSNLPRAASDVTASGDTAPKVGSPRLRFAAATAFCIGVLATLFVALNRNGDLQPENVTPAEQNSDVAATSSDNSLPTTAADPIAIRPEEPALYFDGETSGVAVKNLRYDGSHPLTLEAIVTPEDSAAGMVITTAGFDLISNGYRWETYAAVTDPARQTYRRGGVRIVPDEPIHIAAVYDGETVHVYCNGQRSDSLLLQCSELAPNGRPVNVMGGRPSCGGSIFIGCKAPSSEQPFNFRGRIHEVRISNVARAPEQLQPKDHFESDDRTLALYHFDEGRGTVLKDASGNGNDAEIIGATTWVEVEDWQPPAVRPMTEDWAPFALKFDGQSSGVLLESVSYDGTHPLTIEARASAH
jgi:serine/threonine protein kinase